MWRVQDQSVRRAHGAGRPACAATREKPADRGCGGLNGPGWAVGAVVAAGLACGGCSLVPAHLRTQGRYDRGLVVVLPGVEGESLWTRELALGLDEGGVRSAIESYDWTVGVPGAILVNLGDLERNRQQARLLAERIAAYRREQPGRAVQILGYSGGGGVSVLALEALPEGEQIDALVLIAPALSPDYDLRPALRRVRHGACHFYSPNDVGILQVGTSVFGSIDRKYGVSAGAVGFVEPSGLSAADRVLYQTKLHQIRWTPELGKRGATGTHVGWLSRRFAREYLAPLLRQYERESGQDSAPEPAGGT